MRFSTVDRLSPLDHWMVVPLIWKEPEVSRLPARKRPAASEAPVWVELSGALLVIAPAAPPPVIPVATRCAAVRKLLVSATAPSCTGWLLPAFGVSEMKFGLP